MTEPATGDLPALPTLGTPPGRVQPEKQRHRFQSATVVQVRRETPVASTFRLELPVWHPHVPGQHYVVRLTAPDGYRAERSYSIASPPEDVGHVELTVERLEEGEVSSYLHDAVREGDRLEVRGPFGGWFVWHGHDPVLLVGGGSGVVPLMAMVRHARAAGVAVPRLVVSARSHEELFYAGEYGEETTVVLTRSTPHGWARPAGRLAAGDLAPALAALPQGATTYVCGSTGFAGAAERLLMDAGVPSGSIRVERFGPS